MLSFFLIQLRDSICVLPRNHDGIPLHVKAFALISISSAVYALDVKPDFVVAADGSGNHTYDPKIIVNSSK